MCTYHKICVLLTFFNCKNKKKQSELQPLLLIQIDEKNMQLGSVYCQVAAALSITGKTAKILKTIRLEILIFETLGLERDN